jgi:hypothetical protein
MAKTASTKKNPAAVALAGYVETEPDDFGVASKA